MKKTMIYILALTLAFSTLLAGCGEMRDDKTPPAETPQATILPETMMPDPADGEVRDRDGIITETVQRADFQTLEEEIKGSRVKDLVNKLGLK